MKLVLTLIILVVFLQAKAQIMSGSVIDGKTGDALSFVKVGCKGNFTFTDIDGKFTLPETCDSIEASYVGYQAITMKKAKDLRMILYPKEEVLKDLVIHFKEDQAYKIARKVIHKKKENDPLQKQFSYEAYNKFYFTIKLDSEYVKKTTDSMMIRINEQLQSHHLFLSETLLDRYRLSEVKDKKVIKYERVSGFKENLLSITASAFQSFSFYDKQINVGGILHINPMSKPGLKIYDLTMLDMTLIEGDSIFTIAFSAHKPGRQSLSGIIQINSDNYAIQYVDAQPDLPIDEMQLHVKQIYKQMEGFWFPSQLNTSINMPGFSDEMTLVGSGRTYISKVSFTPDVSHIKFNHLEITHAPYMDSAYQDSLTEKERETYVIVDSIGKEAKLDAKIRFLGTLVSGKLPVSFVSIDLKHLLRYNEFEGFRPGFGLSTNDKVSRYFEIGTYGAYGFKDKMWKYGGYLTFNLNKDYNAKLNFSYKNDIYYNGVTEYDFLSGEMLADQQMINLYRNKADYIESYRISLQTHLLKHFKGRLFAQKKTHFTPGDYTFQYDIAENSSLLLNTYHLSEIGAELRFAYNEKYTRLFGQLVSTGSDSPVLHLKYTKGLDLMDADFSCNRLDFMASYKRIFLNGHTPTFRVFAGYIDKTLPLSLMYNVPAFNKSFSLEVLTSFGTMHSNEFYAQQYAAYYFAYKFNKLYNTNFSAPQIMLVSKGIIGRMNNLSTHLDQEFKVPENGYFESGLFLNNIYKQQFTGYGLGVLYRHGAYYLREFKNNIAVKLSIDFSF